MADTAQTPGKKEVKTVGEGLAAKIIAKNKLLCELRDLCKAYRNKIKNLDDDIMLSAMESDQTLLSFA